MAKPKEENKVGRPEKINDDILAKLEAAFKVGANDTEACEYAEIDPSTLYRYQQRNEEFCNKKKGWKSRPTLKAKMTVYKNLDDPKIALDYLKLRDDDFSTKVKADVINKTPSIVVANQQDAELITELMNVKAD
jgi:hypothetical protein